MRSEPLLEIRNLVTQFRTESESVKAVNDVSFTLNHGETIGIVGESGSGKSVTSLSVMQLIPNPPGKITAGEIIYHTRENKTVDLLKLGRDEMRKYRGNEISMIFQEPMTSLNPVMKCGEQVMESIRLHLHLSASKARERALGLFTEVQLPFPEQMMERYPHQLSGGQKQRVMIAMAMSCDPRVLIADEPTTALDVTVQKTILDLMQKLQARHNMGILFITHDLGVIAELADKVVVMYKGKIVEQGPVIDIFSNPVHPYTKSLLACRPPLDIRVKRLPVVSDFMVRDSAGIISEVNKSVSDALQGAIFSDEERKREHQVLYARSKILQVRHLSTWFPVKKSLFGKPAGYIKAVDDVLFDVYEGETVGLVGESGCGKTTLGRTLLKLALATAGEVIYQNADVLKMPENEYRQYRKNMQLIFQDPYSSLNPRITIGEAILEPMAVHGILKNYAERRDKVMALLLKVGLEEKHFGRYPHEFSGGQRQRICIARALGLNPGFIICDESVSALDVSVQAQVLNLLNELKHEFKFTAIFISHDLGVVKFMSDRMIVMQKGRIEEIGDPDLIYKNPASEYTRRLIDAIPKGTIESIRLASEKKRTTYFS